MSDATKLPTTTDLVTTQLSKPDFEIPALQNALNATDVTSTVKFNGVLTKSDGTTLTGAFLGTAKTSTGYAESMWFPAASSTDGQTFTGVVRGIDLDGLDYTVGDSSLVVSHAAGEKVVCGVSAVIENMTRGALQGTIATGGTNFKVGDGASGTKTYSIENDTGTVGILRNNGTNTQYSDDGSTWANISDVSASVLVKTSAADTTPGYLSDKIVSTSGLDFSINNPGANETYELTLDLSEAGYTGGPLATVISDVTATATELNDVPTLVAGPTSDASAYHTHSSIAALSMTAGEAIDGSTTPVALCQMGDNIVREITVHVGGSSPDGDDSWDFEPGGSDLAFGDADATTRRAQSFTFLDTTSGTVTVTGLLLMLQKVAGPTDNIFIDIYDDDSNKPGSLVTNGTSNAIVGSTLSSTYEPVNFTWSTPPEITPGDKYWFVLRRSGANDAVNYYEVSYEAADNYSSHSFSTYTASTTSWSTHASQDLIFQLQFSCDYGNKVFKLDASDRARGNFIGFTTDNVAADAAIGVIAPAQIITTSGLDPNQSYYGSTTAGAIAEIFTPGTEVALINVGRARSTTQLFSWQGKKYFYKEIALLDTNETATSVTSDYIVETGFEPEKVTFIWYKDETSTNDDGQFEYATYLGTSLSGGIQISELDGSDGTFITATSRVDNSPSTSSGNNVIYPTAIYENGLKFRHKQDADDTAIRGIKILVESS